MPQSQMQSKAATVLNRMPSSEIEALKFALEDLDRRVHDKMYDLPELVEIGSRLTVHLKTLDKITKRFREDAKANMLELGIVEQEGRTCVAVVKKIIKERLHTENVKAFLGSQLSKFMVMSEEVTITYKPKG